jgi:hypothetical protein
VCGFFAIFALQRLSKRGLDAVEVCNYKLIGRMELSVDLQHWHAELDFPISSQELKRTLLQASFLFGLLS